MMCGYLHIDFKIFLFMVFTVDDVGFSCKFWVCFFQCNNRPCVYFNGPFLFFVTEEGFEMWLINHWIRSQNLLLKALWFLFLKYSLLNFIVNLYWIIYLF